MGTRVIKQFYYINYPDHSPADPENAASEVRVEIGREDSPYDFDECYSIQVATIVYLRQRLAVQPEQVLPITSMLIVDRFEDSIIMAGLRSILDEIDDYGTLIE